ncbi:hypothetical protein OPV22_007632 [Ensete ventricosum]|uniref:PHD-type domain-containing protein n=1 Tax=Ensete ventricosum TaxID=4639 RepID=A0AAV8RTU7_ENSVE|nr:hypothetical protein OPV22_007632 [Ensete ventricosum]
MSSRCREKTPWGGLPHHCRVSTPGRPPGLPVRAQSSSMTAGEELVCRNKHLPSAASGVTTKPSNFSFHYFVLHMEHVSENVRILRSMTNGKDKTSAGPSNSTTISMTKTRKKKRKGESALNNEFLLIKKRVRYLLTRINYEQSLIDAYSNEGWKGQSLEKIRPEKELERAKSEILRCKLRIRESFRHLDSLLSEGKLEENLFDDDGQIDSEAIFCAKCGSKDLSADNDIILCDGNCDRGFHQKCLNPPLATDEIPPGDQGWLCPACDCKVDCLELLNEFQGSDLSIEDTWEKIFPEAAAVANEVGIEDQEEGSSSEESDSVSLSEEAPESPRHNNFNDLGLPSDDSEDDDYDPECPDPDKDVQKEGSDSNESDFTSDSDEFCVELSKSTNTNEVSSFSLSEPKLLDGSCEGRDEIHESPINAKPSPVMEGEPGQANTFPVSKKRELEHLDYEKLSDEAYGKQLHVSSKDEDWSVESTAKKAKKDDNKREHGKLPGAKAQSADNRRSLDIEGKIEDDNGIDMPNLDQPQVSKATSESTPDKGHENLVEQCDGDQLLGLDGNTVTTSARKQFGQETYQKLQEIFKENQYPSRKMKENLAEEVGVTAKKISKWFENARHNLRVSAKGSDLPGTSGAAVSDKGTDHARTSMYKGNPFMEPSRKNSESSKGNAESSAGSNEKISRKANNHKDQVGSGAGDQLKRTVDSKRQMAVARELRKMRNNSR